MEQKVTLTLEDVRGAVHAIMNREEALREEILDVCPNFKNIINKACDALNYAEETGGETKEEFLLGENETRFLVSLNLKLPIMWLSEKYNMRDFAEYYKDIFWNYLSLYKVSPAVAETLEHTDKLLRLQTTISALILNSEVLVSKFNHISKYMPYSMTIGRDYAECILNNPSKKGGDKSGVTNS